MYHTSEIELPSGTCLRVDYSVMSTRDVSPAGVEIDYDMQINGLRVDYYPSMDRMITYNIDPDRLSPAHYSMIEDLTFKQYFKRNR